MRVRTGIPIALAVTLVFVGTGCKSFDPFGSNCRSRQKRGIAGSITGRIEAGQVLSHTVLYDQRGSQNSGTARWESTTGPQVGADVRFYVTRTTCMEFVPPPPDSELRRSRGACTVIGYAGVHFTPLVPSGSLTYPTFTITNGRGNPDILGVPAEYKLWVVGDPRQSATYTIDISWFYGPDC